MGGRRSGVRLPALATAFGASVLYALLVRPRLLMWGATADELSRAYPGDELVPDADGGATMATILPAPPDMVWPRLAQMGGDRGGWHSWDWVDNSGQPSADRIVPEWQTLAVGQRLKGPTNWWTVAVVEPNHTMVLRSSYSLSWPVGRSFDPCSDPIPRAHVDGIWGFHLRQTLDGGTRLVVRTRARSRPRPLTRMLGLPVFEPVPFIMQTRQFHNLHTRVAAQVIAPPGGGWVNTSSAVGRKRTMLGGTRAAMPETARTWITGKAAQSGYMTAVLGRSRFAAPIEWNDFAGSRVPVSLDARSGHPAAGARTATARCLRDKGGQEPVVAFNACGPTHAGLDLSHRGRPVPRHFGMLARRPAAQPDHNGEVADPAPQERRGQRRSDPDGLRRQECLGDDSAVKPSRPTRWKLRESVVVPALAPQVGWSDPGRCQRP
jgi:hypothetical protein